MKCIRYYCIYFVILACIRIVDAGRFGGFRKISKTVSIAKPNPIPIPTWQRNLPAYDRTLTVNRFGDRTAILLSLENQRVVELNKRLKEAEIRNKKDLVRETWDAAVDAANSNHEPEKSIEFVTTEWTANNAYSKEEPTGFVVLVVLVAVVIVALCACICVVKLALKKRRGAIVDPGPPEVLTFLPNEAPNNSRNQEQTEIEALLEARLNYHIFQLFASEMFDQMQQVQQGHNQVIIVADTPPSYRDLTDEVPPPPYVSVTLQQ